LDNEELEEERRLAYVGITRAEEKLYLTRARTRLLYGRTNSNPPSRFLEEIPDKLKEPVSAYGGRSVSLGGYGGFGQRIGGNAGAGFGAKGPAAGGFGARPSAAAGAAASAGGKDGLNLAAGDKVQHAKWGVGTVVAVKGTGNDMELQIAFPAPVGVKRLLAAFAPVTKV
jgi:DNA helicase-2/ATP-dependent DNA helicase PcrA